jgi:hypothetical protein
MDGVNIDEPTGLVPGASPDAVAWRLSNVENEVKGLKSELRTSTERLESKLDGIASGFATHKDIEVAKEQAKTEHNAIYEKINDLELDISGLKKRNWVQNTLSAILGAVLTLLISYFFANITK